MGCIGLTSGNPFVLEGAELGDHRGGVLWRHDALVPLQSARGQATGSQKEKRTDGILDGNHGSDVAN